MKFADPNARLHASSNVILRVKPWMAWFIEISKRTGGVAPTEIACELRVAIKKVYGN